MPRNMSLFLLDPLLFLVIGSMSGALVFIVASSPPGIASFSTIVGEADIDDLLEKSRTNIEDVILGVSLGEWLERAFIVMAPFTAVVASYTLGMDRELGYSRLIFLGGIPRIRYFAHRLLVPWVACSAAAGGSMAFGLVLIDVFMILSYPIPLVRLALKALILAGLQLLLCYVTVILIRGGYRALVASLLLMYLIGLSGAWRILASPGDILFDSMVASVLAGAIVVVYFYAVRRLPV